MAAEIGAEDAGVANGLRPEESDAVVIGNVGVDETEEDSNFVIPRRTRRKHWKFKLQEVSMAAPGICGSFSRHLCEDPGCANLGRGTDHLVSSAGSVPKERGLARGEIVANGDTLTHVEPKLKVKHCGVIAEDIVTEVEQSKSAPRGLRFKRLT